MRLPVPPPAVAFKKVDGGGGGGHHGGTHRRVHARAGALAVTSPDGGHAGGFAPLAPGPRSSEARSCAAAAPSSPSQPCCTLAAVGTIVAWRSSVDAAAMASSCLLACARPAARYPRCRALAAQARFPPPASAAVRLTRGASHSAQHMPVPVLATGSPPAACMRTRRQLN